MLYHMHEFQHAALAPFRIANEALGQIFRHPLVPVAHTDWGRAVAAGTEIVERLTRRYGKPAFGIDSVVAGGRRVAVEEVEVLSHRFCTLVHFRRDTRRRDPRVLVVAPLSGHYATLLRGTVATLLGDHDVYVTDWVNAQDVPLRGGAFDLDDYIEYVIDFLTMLGPEVHVVAVCQPAVPVLAAVSLMAADDALDEPRSMVLMGGPIDTRRNPTQVNRLAESRPIAWFDKVAVHRVPLYYPGGMRRVYPGFLQLGGFLSMNLDRHVGAHVELFNHLIEGDGDGAGQHRRFYDEYMSVMDLPAEYYLQTVRTVFQEHALARGIMTWRGRPVDPGAIANTALMTVEGEKDDITGAEQTRAAHDLCVNIPAPRHRDHLQRGVGHYGIFNGRRWREEIYPRVRRFIRDHA